MQIDRPACASAEAAIAALPAFLAAHGGRLALGIDPGVTGALALASEDGHLLVCDIPTCRESRRTLTAAAARRVGSKSRYRRRGQYEVTRLARYLRQLAPARDRLRVFLEEAQVILHRPGARACPLCKRQLGQTAYTGVAVGYANGLWPLALAYLHIPLTLVRPHIWKKAMGLSSDKARSRRLAARRFHHQRAEFARDKDHNRAEAALIAYYGLHLLKESPADGQD